MKFRKEYIEVSPEDYIDENIKRKKRELERSKMTYADKWLTRKTPKYTKFCQHVR